MKRLIWSKSARRELYAIVEYYDQFDSDLPDKLLNRVEDTPLVLLDYPGLGSPTERRGVRKWRVRQTPFLLFYAAQGNTVEILRVRHAGSDSSDDHL